jgi:predicted ferric reductase
MFSNSAVIKDVYFWERIGYRNAWVTAMQLPLVYLLASKANIIGFLTGISHERLNWLHRWVARTMFVTATVHGFHFWVQWVRADFLEIQLEAMPMVKYGLGAWAILLWTVVSSIYPLRHFGYEFFVAQHVVSMVVLLWVVYVHVPEDGRWTVWFSIACLVFDRVARWLDLLWFNLRIVPSVRVGRRAPDSLVPSISVSFPKRGGCSGDRRLGHQAVVTTIGDATVLTIKDVHFSWRAGQHLYLWVPRLGPFEAHPYTISCAHQIQGRCCCNSIQLVIRAHGGFSRRLHEFGRKMRDKNGRDADLTAFVSSPYGRPPRVDVYETLVLISASTGASFTLPILEGIVFGESSGCTKWVEFVLLTRRGEEVDLYVGRIRDIMARFKQRGIVLNVHIAVTSGDGAARDKSSTFASTSTTSTSASAQKPHRRVVEKGPTTDVEAAPPPASVQVPGGGCCCCDDADEQPSATAGAPIEGVIEYDCRPDIEELVRAPVEAAYGETAVVVCGGRSLVASVRNLVVRLSDERAVHKGTGAQGIAVFAEEYSF